MHTYVTSEYICFLSQIDASVQVEEEIQRRVRDTSAALTANVFGGLCHASDVLLLRDCRHGVVCWIQFEELLHVRML